MAMAMGMVIEYMKMVKMMVSKQGGDGNGKEMVMEMAAVSVCTCLCSCGGVQEQSVFVWNILKCECVCV